MSLVEREPVRDDVLRVKVPPHQALDKFFHQPRGSDPRSVNRFLIVNDVGGWIECHGVPPSPTIAILPPFARGSNGDGASFGVRGTVYGAFNTQPTGEFAYFVDAVRAGRQN